MVQEEKCFKAISYLELWQPLCSAERNHLCNFGIRHHEGAILWDYFEFGLVIRGEMLFKDISYLELWSPFCSAEGNHLCKISRGYHEEQFCEIILSLDQWFKRTCVLKIFLIWSFGDHFVK